MEEGTGTPQRRRSSTDPRRRSSTAATATEPRSSTAATATKPRSSTAATATEPRSSVEAEVLAAEPYLAMAEPSPPPSNSGLRILLTKDRAPTSSPSTVAAVSSHADRDRIIGVFRTALARNESPEAFALQAVQEAIKPQKQTVLGLEENQSLENALRRLLQELVSSAVQSDKGIMHYGNSLDSGESNCLITRLLDIMLYLCERGHVEGGMVFALLEDLTDMSTIKDCKDVFGYIESKQDILGKQELFGRGKLVMLRTCNQLLRRLSKSNDVVFCGRIIMFLAHFFPLSERSALNIKGVFNTSNETKYEKDATDGISVDFNFYQTLWSLQEHFRNPALTSTNPTKWQKFSSNLTVVLSTFEAGRCNSTAILI